jgi:hypothetical protein
MKQKLFINLEKNILTLYEHRNTASQLLNQCSWQLNK